MISMLVMLGLSGLAQKPQKLTLGYPEGSDLQQSTIDRQAPDRMSNFRSLRQTRDDKSTVSGTPVLSNRLKSEPIPVSPVEKLDSLVDYYYDTDSMKWFLEGADYYLYDTKGRNYSLGRSLFDIQMQAMVPLNKYEISYSDENQITGQTIYNWNSVTTKWEPYERTSFTYDANGRPTIFDYSFWDALSGDWVNFFSDTTSYTGSGNIWKKYSYAYDTMAMTWDPLGGKIKPRLFTIMMIREGTP